MGRLSTKENKNRYQLIREELGLSREKASELLESISPERLEKIENERSDPHPDEVLLMSQKYKKPSLCNHYCATQCPIGQQYVPEVQVKELSSIVLEMLASLNAAHKQKDRLIEIAADGMTLMGTLPEEMTATAFAAHVAAVLGTPVRAAGDKTVKKVALCGGAAGSSMFALMGKVDCFITGEVKHHEWLMAAGRINVIVSAHSRLQHSCIRNARFKSYSLRINKRYSEIFTKAPYGKLGKCLHTYMKKCSIINIVVEHNFVINTWACRIPDFVKTAILINVYGIRINLLTKLLYILGALIGRRRHNSVINE